MEFNNALHSLVFPAQVIYSLVAKIYPPVKTRGVSEGVRSIVNSIVRNRVAFLQFRSLLPSNLLPFLHFRVLKWNSMLSPR